MCPKDARSQLMGLEFSITHSRRPADRIVLDMLSFLLNKVIISFMFYFTSSILKEQEKKSFNNNINAKRDFDAANTGPDVFLMRFVANFHNSRIRAQDLTLTFIKELTTVALEKKPETHCKEHKQSPSEKVPKFPNTCRHIHLAMDAYASVPLTGIIHAQQKIMLLYGEMCKASYSTDHWREQIIKIQSEYKHKLGSMTVIYMHSRTVCFFF